MRAGRASVSMGAGLRCLNAESTRERETGGRSRQCDDFAAE